VDLTIRDAAAIFDVPEGRIYRWIQDDDLPCREVNGRHCFNRTELLEWAAVRGVRFRAGLFGDPSHTDTGEERLAKALEIGGILSGLGGSDKRDVLRSVVERLRLPEGFDRAILLQLFLARESMGSTAVGDGIAIPHPRSPVVVPVLRPIVTLCFLDQPIEFGAVDRQPVHTLFVLVSPTIRVHLRMLARIACALRDERFRAVLKRRAPNEEILREIRRVEESFERSSFDAREPG
jgi:PTS system nitrogen regulatory IIA component